MKEVVLALVILLFGFSATGCSSSGGPADDAVKAFEAMSPEDRFKEIRTNTGLSPDMKRTAIDNIQGATDGQKAQWKSEVGQ